MYLIMLRSIAAKSYEKLFAITIVIVFVTSGCISTPRISRMVIDNVEIQSKHAASVCIIREEGVEIKYDKQGFGGKITAAAYLKAVIESIKKSNLFSQVVSDGKEDYQLSATLTKSNFGTKDITGAGYSLRYTISAQWVLIDKKTSKILFDETITGTGGANFLDAFNGITRNTIARERAVKKNIAKGIQRLSSLEF